MTLVHDAVLDTPTAAPIAPRRTAASWGPAALSALLALLVYAVTLAGAYVYDDQQIVLRDERVITTDHFSDIWTEDYFNGGADNLYRPLVTLSYFVQWRLHGDLPWAFHLVNWLAHAGVSALVAEFARRLSRGNVIASCVAGVLFAVHPVHTEVVANIVGRAESFCALGAIGAMVLFLTPTLTVPRAIAIGCCATSAMLCKEQGLLVPVLFFSLHFLRGHLFPVTHENRVQERNARLALLLLLSWPVATIVFLRENVLGLKFWWDRAFLDFTLNPLILASPRDRVLMPITLLGRYAELLIAPRQMSPDYGGLQIWHVARTNDPYFLLGVASIALYGITLLVALLKRAWPLVFCLLALGMTYGLIGNVVTLIGTILGDRLLYLPSAFFLIALALIVSRWKAQVVIPALVLVTAMASVRTFTYAKLWNDPVALFETSLAHFPKATRLHFALSEELVRRGELEKAADALKPARESMPNYAVAWYRSALVSLRLGRFEEAEQFARKAASIDPRVTDSTVWDYIRERKVLVEH